MLGWHFPRALIESLLVGGCESCIYLRWLKLALGEVQHLKGTEIRVCFMAPEAAKDLEVLQVGKGFKPEQQSAIVKFAWAPTDRV